MHESKRAAADLARVGIHIQGVLLNHVLLPEDCVGSFAEARYKMQQYYLHLAAQMYSVPLFSMPLLVSEVIGIEHVDHLRSQIMNKITVV